MSPLSWRYVSRSSRRYTCRWTLSEEEMTATSHLINTLLTHSIWVVLSKRSPNRTKWVLHLLKSNEIERTSSIRAQSAEPLHLFFRSRKTFSLLVVQYSVMAVWLLCYGNVQYVFVNGIRTQLHYSVVWESIFHNDTTNLSVWIMQGFYYSTQRSSSPSSTTIPSSSRCRDAFKVYIFGKYE